MIMETHGPWPAGKLVRAAAFVWSAPIGLLGAVGAFLFAVLGWGHLRVNEGAIEVIGRGPFAAWMAGRGWAAFTLGWTIWFWREEYADHPSIARHERAHIRQYLRLGVLMALAYPLAGIHAHLRGGCFYKDNVFERTARREAGQFVD
jgi:hypothetical protein